MNEQMNDRIIEVRKTLGMTQRMFADSLEVTHGVIINVEYGRAPINKWFIKLICLQFGVSRQYLETGEGEMFEKDKNLKLVAQQYGLNEESEVILKQALELPPDAAAALIELGRRLTAHQSTEHLAHVHMAKSEIAKQVQEKSDIDK